MKVKLGDRVKMKRAPIVDARIEGKIIRVSEVPGIVGVMWKLEEGGVLCQSENIQNLVVVKKRKKSCTSKQS